MAATVSPTERIEGDLRIRVRASPRLDRPQRARDSRAHAAWPSTRWETIMATEGNDTHREPWNKGKIGG